MWTAGSLVGLIGSFNFLHQLSEIAASKCAIVLPESMRNGVGTLLRNSVQGGFGCIAEIWAPVCEGFVAGA